MHEFDAVVPSKYCPTSHSVHALAPIALFVVEPRMQRVQFEAVGLAEYSPAAQSVQLVAPGATPVSVVEPTWHTSQ